MFTAEGRNELDAAIMDGATLLAGAVAGLRRTRNPISLARAVMELSPHVMLIGELAEVFGQEHGIERIDAGYFFTENRWHALEKFLAVRELPIPPQPIHHPATADAKAGLAHEEGAQGTMLDVDHGTYPFVTSSNTVAGQAAAGSGQGPGAIDYVLGIVKAYTTRVGGGPFPTELTDAIGTGLGERGREFGTVTGRPRRCGWFDAVLVRQSVKVNGIHGIALTKLDVLDGMDELKVCVGYRIDGQTLDHLPASAARQARVEPIYETMQGWQDSTRGARSWAALPATAIKYIRRIEELIEAPVALLSTSPERDDTILVHDPFVD